MNRLELALLGLFLACWTVNLLVLAGLVRVAGNYPMSLYGIYGVAAALGWLAGNVYVQRTRGFPGALRRRFLLIYFLGPPGIVYLLRAMAPVAEQVAAPLVPVYAFGVFGIFFLVPVSLKATARPRR